MLTLVIILILLLIILLMFIKQILRKSYLGTMKLLNECKYKETLTFPIDSQFWSDGENIYYSTDSKHYVLDVEKSIWIEISD